LQLRAISRITATSGAHADDLVVYAALLTEVVRRSARSTPPTRHGQWQCRVNTAGQPWIEKSRKIC
jgi:hypothetical protein